MGVVGVVSSTGTAMLLGLDSGPIHSGLFGFNGLLVGLALGCFGLGDCRSPRDPDLQRRLSESKIALADANGHADALQGERDDLAAQVARLTEDLAQESAEAEAALNEARLPTYRQPS